MDKCIHDKTCEGRLFRCEEDPDYLVAELYCIKCNKSIRPITSFIYECKPKIDNQASGSSISTSEKAISSSPRKISR